MTQPGFTFARDEMLPTDTHVTEPVEVRRLAGQISRILARLKEGPATARELSDISLNYRARLSDLRKHGYVIRCDEDFSTGKSLYTLERR
jgi:hypothetical protein